MVQNLFPRFLEDSDQYEHSERFWQDLWKQINPVDRTGFGWTSPWLGTGSVHIKDGNPIFSAYSPTLRRGLRVIQEEPAGPDLEIGAWLDTFGGDLTDPDHVDELVISCVLSDEASRAALPLIAAWVRGESFSLKFDDAGLPVAGESESLKRN